MGVEGLQRFYAMASAVELAQALEAYPSYHYMLNCIATQYKQPLDRVVAAFVSLSPNSDYMGNLRSLVSVLEGLRHGVALEAVVVSTYNHCKQRAWKYLLGELDFVHTTKGKKILNFYHNILEPKNPLWVTVDGHIVAAWYGADNMTMKQALLNARTYEQIKSGVQQLALAEGLVPNQYQAVVWFVRKRFLGIRYDLQYDLFSDRAGIVWDRVQPYPFRRGM